MTSQLKMEIHSPILCMFTKKYVSTVFKGANSLVSLLGIAAILSTILFKRIPKYSYRTQNNVAIAVYLNGLLQVVLKWDPWTKRELLRRANPTAGGGVCPLELCCPFLPLPKSWSLQYSQIRTQFFTHVSNKQKVQFRQRLLCSLHLPDVLFSVFSNVR